MPRREPRVGTTEAAAPVLLGLVLAAAGCVVAYLMLGSPALLGAEDAAIGFRYARNLAEGHGVVFNPGSERVEGFTSISWLLVNAAAYRVFGEASLEPVLLLISLAMTVATLAVVLRLLLTAGVRRGAVLVGVLWLAGQAGYFYWAGLSLMDVAPWALGLALLALLVDERLGGSERPSPWSGPMASVPLVVFLVLTRPESMLVVPGAVVIAVLAYGWSAKARRLALELGATVVLAVGALTAFRLAYFGVPLPNTYYTKVSPDVLWRLRTGVAYVGEYLDPHPVGWALILAVIGVVVVRARHLVAPGGHEPVRVVGRGMVSRGAFVAAFVALGIASIVWGGGDHYQGHRFLASWLVLGAVPLAVAVELITLRAGRERPAAGDGVAWICALLALVALPGQWTAYAEHGIRAQAIDVGMQGRFVGATLTEAFDAPRPELGLWMVGGASYTYHGPVKDLLGLNWKAMGMSPGDRKGPRDHAAFNTDVFWSAPPDVMLPEPEVTLTVTGIRCVRTVLGGVMQGLLRSDRFAASFEPVRIQRGETEPMIAYARTDWLPTAPPSVERVGWDYCDPTAGN